MLHGVDIVGLMAFGACLTLGVAGLFGRLRFGTSSPVVRNTKMLAEDQFADESQFGDKINVSL